MNTSPIFRKIVELIPERQMLKNTISYRPWYLIWLFTIKIEREIFIWYSTENNKLSVNFANNKNHKPFPNKELAEKWFGSDIDISEYTNDKIITRDFQAICITRCRDCGHVKESQKIIVTAKGPKSKIERNILFSSKHNDVCEKCNSDNASSTTVESYE